MKASDIIKTRRAELNLTLEDIGKYVGLMDTIRRFLKNLTRNLT